MLARPFLDVNHLPIDIIGYILPEAYGRAPPLLDSTWQVALLMTSNPIIEHGERSSQISLQFG
jgi:hypothetical protein